MKIHSYKMVVTYNKYQKIVTLLNQMEKQGFIKNIHYTFIDIPEFTTVKRGQYVGLLRDNSRIELTVHYEHGEKYDLI